MEQEGVEIAQEYLMWAGRMNYDPATKKVSADKRKGQIRIIKNATGETILHWTEKGKAQPEVELMLLQQDAYLEILDKNKGKMLIVKQHSNDDLYFFWMQEHIENLNLIVEEINDIINV